MAGKDRYAFRPVALCSVLALGCALLIWCGLQQVMMLDGVRLLLGVVLLIAGEEKSFARKGASLIKPVVDMDGIQDVDMGDTDEDMNVGDEIEIGEE